ncbi:MAG: CbtA family protein [Mycobacterium kyogaense]|uniref:CbtA family protein n=1 Tax=Mycobacterium kyogaense TaxID=2212479 RepID=UPI002FFD0A59
MPLTASSNGVLRYLLPGVVAGAVTFLVSRVLVAPLIDAAVDAEAALEHAAGGEHAHAAELFTRSVQENVGAAVGVIGFGVVMGVLFAVAHTVVARSLATRGVAPNPTALALLLAGGMFVTIALVPALKYPANPPGVGLDDTVAERTSASLMMTILSVVVACAALAAVVVAAHRVPGWRLTGVAVLGYAAVMCVAAALLPSFHEVPDGFPAETLADFRLYSVLIQAVLWAVIGSVWSWLAARRPVRDESSSVSPVFSAR